MNNWVVGFIDWNLVLDILGGPNHKTADECEGPDKCGFDAMLLADTDKQIIYPEVFYYYMGHFRYIIYYMYEYFLTLCQLVWLNYFNYVHLLSQLT